MDKRQWQSIINETKALRQLPQVFSDRITFIPSTNINHVFRLESHIVQSQLRTSTL